MRLVSAITIIVFATHLFPAALAEQAQDRRVALVVGNSEYISAPRLENPKNDAADIATTLEGLGFEVIKGFDLDKAAIDRTIRDFAKALSGAKVSLLFYAGHGLQVSGQNYLMPIDATLTTAAALDFEMLRLDLVQRVMERETKTNIIILDACRDNPLARNLARTLGTRSAEVGRGLASIESGEGTLISFSTQPGNVALDGTGRNSPFTKALLKHIPTVGDDLPTILINVRNDVMAQTERRQVPWEHSALTARFFFTEPKAPIDQEAELHLWNSVKDSTDPSVIDTYLRKYPLGSFAVIARTLKTALEAQTKMEQAMLEEGRKREGELRKAEEEVKKAREAAETLSNKKVTTLSERTQKGSFDGTWKVIGDGGSGCNKKHWANQIIIEANIISSPGVSKGKVASDGKFKYTYISSRGGAPGTYTGQFWGHSGTGNYNHADICLGSLKLTRESDQ